MFQNLSISNVRYSHSGPFGVTKHGVLRIFDFTVVRFTILVCKFKFLDGKYIDEGSREGLRD